MHTLFVLLSAAATAFGQDAPPVVNRPWTGGSDLLRSAPEVDRDLPRIEPDRAYTLAELIDVAQRSNPQTRVAWEQAREQAEELGVARTELYPTVSVAALASVNREDVLIANAFYGRSLQTSALAFDVDYLILDAGGRAARIDTARAEVLAANFAFNDAHRRVIYQVAGAYYQVLNASGQQEAAAASLANAQAVQRAAEDRLQNGLATLPDVLEARSATAQAEYELQSVIGAEETARGNLATALGSRPTTIVRLQPLNDIATPESIDSSVESAIERAFAQRPDLMTRLAEIRSAEARAREARSALYPSLSVSAQPAPQLLHGRQPPSPWAATHGLAGAAALTLDWTVFDGGARSRALSAARAEAAAGRGRLAEARDRIANDVWAAYVRFTTALRQRRAAVALLDATSQSYAAALESYTLGLRSLLDVTAAQRTLAQARSAEVLARAQVLTAFAELAFQTADSIQSPAPRPRP